MELTLRTPAALDALQQIRAEVPQMLAGVGTVLTPEQLGQAADAGAAFAVAPGTNPRVIRAARDRGIPFAPGVATASDLEAAIELGCRELKFFPAEPTGGMPYLKSLAAPYAHLGLRFIPLGGLTEANMRVYLENPSVMAIGGSWLAPRERIQVEDWAAITASARAAKAVYSSLQEPDASGSR
jgi:2-dehydro-3-deoxyphosphogluconate aldolase/(4S)-4-hydroxy-2-oxoglutarate aldolase